MCVCVWCHLSKVVFETFPTKETRDSDRRISRSISCQSFAKNIFRQSPDSCCETVNISKILKSQETVGGFFFSNARVYVVSRPTLDALPVHFASRGPFCRRPEEKEGGKRRERKKKKLFDHQRPPQFVLFIISERARRTNTVCEGRRRRLL